MTPRIFSSSKFQASFIQTAFLAIPLIFTLTDKNLDRTKKQEACMAFMLTSSAVWGVSIHGTAKEDSAKAQAAKPSQPQVQVNNATDQQVTAQGPTAVMPRPLASPLPIPKLPRPKP